MMNGESTANYHQYITRDPHICGGEPVITGTRVTLRTILSSLAEGASVAEIVEDFPTVSEAAVWAVISFAAASAQEDMPVAALPWSRLSDHAASRAQG